MLNLNERIEKLGEGYKKHLAEFFVLCSDIYKESDEHRNHLGASLIGATCARKIWLSFRWYDSKPTDARMKRLFNRGHIEEARFLALFKGIGVDRLHTHDERGRQYGFTDGMFRGSADAVAVIDGVAYLLEFKTHSEKSFADLKKKGVEASKPQHYAQMQVLMLGMELERAIYCAVNKNTDELYFEEVLLHTSKAEELKERAQKIIRINTAPPMNETHECNWCEFKEVCHTGRQEVLHCRNCKFYDIEKGCAKGVTANPKEGCENHVAIALVSKRSD